MRNELLKLSHKYNTIPVVIVRILISCVLTFVILYFAYLNIFPRLAIFIACIFLVIELFVKHKLNSVGPPLRTSEITTGSISDSFSNDAYLPFVLYPNTSGIVSSLLKEPSVKFILEKTEITRESIKLVDVPTEELANKSYDLAKKLGKDYVEPVDVILSYLLLIEKDEKLLFKSKLKEEDIMLLSEWAEINNKLRTGHRYSMSGGIFDGLVYGWTYETGKFTKYVEIKAKPHILGREKEFKRLIDTLSKKDNNNAVIVGEIGSGKETLVEYFVAQSAVGELPKNLNNKRVLELMIGQFISGIANRADLETRLQAVIDEISHSGDVILYISQLENILGSASYGVDLSGAILPHLKAGRLPVIATMTPGNYKKYLEKNPIREAFEEITLDEPSKNYVLSMLFSKVLEIEKANKIFISYKAVLASVDNAKKYLPNDVLPGAAVELLSSAASSSSLRNSKIVTDEDVVMKVEEKTKTHIGAPKASEKKLLLSLEEKIHERVIGQDEAVATISEGIRRIRTGINNSNKPVSFLFLGPTGVGKTETAKTLSEVYFGGEDKMLRFDMSEYQNEDSIRRLLGASPGEGEERGELTDRVHDNPFSLILLDEFEKANPRILDLFLQVLEDGRLTDNKGQTVSFNESIIIATSNAASEFVREEVEKGTIVDKKFKQGLLEFLQTKGLFKPELLNRFDDVVVFKPLSIDDSEKIAKLLLAQVVDKLYAQDIKVTFDDLVVSKIVKDGMDIQFGARPLRRFIQENIEDVLAKMLLKDELKRGDSINITVDKNSFIFPKSSQG